MGNGKTWIALDDRYLKAFCKKKSRAELARALGRSESAIRCRMNLLGIRGQKRPWTVEEEELLETLWGTISFDAMSKRLGRSVTAIKVRASRLNLGPFLLGSDYITFNQLSIALGRGTVSSYMLTSWVQNRGFPVHTKRRDKVSIRVVYLDEFWKWAEQNRSRIDFSNMEENVLGKEPDWVKEQRRHDYQRGRLCKTTPWTTTEDTRLAWMVKDGKSTYLDISRELRRNCGAIKKRLRILGIDGRPVKPELTAWTDEQYGMFAEMIQEGCSYPAMAEVLGRSEKALRGRAYDVYRTESLDKLGVLIGNGGWGSGAPPITMSMLRRQNEREKKERDELVARLCVALKKRRSALGFDGYWQKDMCMNWHPVNGCQAGAENCDVCGPAFVRIRPQYCARCGATFLEREENRFCTACRAARKKQAQRKFAITHGKRNAVPVPGKRRGTA